VIEESLETKGKKSLRGPYFFAEKKEHKVIEKRMKRTEKKNGPI